MPTAHEEDSQLYLGQELDLFRHAVRWKRYLASRLRAYIKGDVLEVGAGKGVNIPYLFREDLGRWVSLEPDPRLCADYEQAKAAGEIPERCELVQGILQHQLAGEKFDTILYIDVLEHIEEDRAEFMRACEHLRPGGHLLLLCPAHQSLYSPFDKAIGHFRRYDKAMYRELSPQAPLKLEYLDSVGMLASLANRLMLKQSYPDQRQVLFWDRVLVPSSRIVDPLIGRRFGKSILGVWKR